MYQSLSCLFVSDEHIVCGIDVLANLLKFFYDFIFHRICEGNVNYWFWQSFFPHISLFMNCLNARFKGRLSNYWDVTDILYFEDFLERHLIELWKRKKNVVRSIITFTIVFWTTQIFIWAYLIYQFVKNVQSFDLRSTFYSTSGITNFVI